MTSASRIYQSEESERARLEEKLREVDERLRREMLARGFDPTQDDNLALTSPLAKLYMEREDLRSALQLLTEKENQAGNHGRD